MNDILAAIILDKCRTNLRCEVRNAFKTKREPDRDFLHAQLLQLVKVAETSSAYYALAAASTIADYTDPSAIVADVDLEKRAAEAWQKAISQHDPWKQCYISNDFLDLSKNGAVISDLARKTIEGHLPALSGAKASLATEWLDAVSQDQVHLPRACFSSSPALLAP